MPIVFFKMYRNDYSLNYTAISRKVVGKNVHATIPKGNMGYDQYTVPDDCSCRTCFCCIPLALANIRPWPFVTILSNFFEKQRTQNNPQCLSGLSRALSRNSCMENLKKPLEKFPQVRPPIFFRTILCFEALVYN